MMLAKATQKPYHARFTETSAGLVEQYMKYLSLVNTLTKPFASRYAICQ